MSISRFFSAPGLFGSVLLFSFATSFPLHAADGQIADPTVPDGALQMEFRARRQVVARPVWETAERETRRKVLRPVWETQWREGVDSVRKVPSRVCRMVEQEIVERVPVTICRTVYEE